MFKLSLPRNNKWKIVLYTVGALALVVIAVQSLLIRQLYVNDQLQQTGEVKGMIIDAVRGLNRELAVDPLTGKLYEPSLRVVFPASPTYKFVDRGAGEDTAMWFIDPSVQSQAISSMRAAQSLTDIFNQVQTVQNCSRQITLSINNAKPNVGSDKLKLVDTKTLKDGRTAYIFKNDDCPYPANNLLDHIKLVDSF